MEVLSPVFTDVDLGDQLDSMNDIELDRLNFGLIGFDRDGVVRRYNAHESQYAGLSRARVLGLSLFTVVAPCMNNAMVAQRFLHAASEVASLDITINYVLTLRMRPVKVKLRLIAPAQGPNRYVLVERLG